MRTEKARFLYPGQFLFMAPDPIINTRAFACVLATIHPGVTFDTREA